LRKKLNPLLFTVRGFRDIPIKAEPVYLPVFATVQFVEGSSYRTHEMPQASTAKFNHQHVFLLGANDPVLLRELITTKTVKILLHDNEEMTEERSDFPKGVAEFTLRDLLKPFC
jgi:hypothetical protein